MATQPKGTPRESSLVAAGDAATAPAAIAGESERYCAIDSGELVRSLDHSAKSVRRRAAGAIAAALDSGELDVGFVRSLLRSRSRSVRWGAAFALGSSGRVDVQVLDASLEALGDEDGDVRWAAASIVIEAARHSESTRASLCELASGAGPVVRKMALLCLSGSGYHDPSPFLVALADEDRLVRIAALTALGRLEGCEGHVLEALVVIQSDDPEPRVRRVAAAILSRFDRERSK